MRQGEKNWQLKAGVVAAFGLVRGLACGDTLQAAASMASHSPLSPEVRCPWKCAVL